MFSCFGERQKEGSLVARKEDLREVERRKRIIKHCMKNVKDNSSRKVMLILDNEYIYNDFAVELYKSCENM